MQGRGQAALAGQFIEGCGRPPGWAGPPSRFPGPADEPPLRGYLQPAGFAVPTTNTWGAAARAPARRAIAAGVFKAPPVGLDMSRPD